MQRRLGRGLRSLIQEPEAGEPRTEIQLQEIRPNPFQPRRAFDPGSLEELKTSIQNHGVLQPVLVRRSVDGYELVSGERRWRASRAAGLATIPAVVREGVTDDQMLELALVENVQRRDLDPIEKAHGYRGLMETLGLTQEAVAAKVGLQRSTVANHLRLLELPEDVQKAVREELLTMGHARALLGLRGEKPQLQLLEEIVRGDLSVREVERRVRASSGKKAAPAKARENAPTDSGAKPPWAVEMETRLRDALGTKVSLLTGAGFRGQIVIDYYDRGDLERLVDGMAPKATL